MTSAPLLAALLAQRRDPDWVQWVLVAVFFGFPIVARAVRALLSRAGLAPPGEGPARAGEDPLDRRRRLREEQRRAEADGEDLFRRLARGEVAEPSPQVSPPPPPPPRARASEAAPEPGHVFERSLPESSLELEGEPAPLAMLGGVSEPAEAPESSLEGALEPAPLAAMDAAALGEADAARPRVPFVLRRGDLRRAVVLTEILGPPVSERGSRA